MYLVIQSFRGFRIYFCVMTSVKILQPKLVRRLSCNLIRCAFRFPHLFVFFKCKKGTSFNGPPGIAHGREYPRGTLWGWHLRYEWESFVEPFFHVTNWTQFTNNLRLGRKFKIFHLKAFIFIRFPPKNTLTRDCLTEKGERKGIGELRERNVGFQQKFLCSFFSVIVIP